MPKQSKRELRQTTAMLREIRKLPPHEREAILLGFEEHSPRVKQLLEEARAIIGRAERRGCSMPIIEDVTRRGKKPTVKGMARSRGRTRIGDAEGTVPSRRLTPKHAVKLEDRYDRMTTEQADWCNDPSSSTGMQIQMIRMRKGTEKEVSGILSAAKKNSRKAR